MYNSKEKLIIWLSMFDFLSLKQKFEISQIIEDYDDLKNLQAYKTQLTQIISTINYNKLVFNVDSNILDSYIEEHNLLGVKMVTLYSSHYPELLKESFNAPIMLYCKGDTSLLCTDCIAVVGTRRCTKYGKDITHQITYDLAKAGLTIVSGLADGVDSIAHNATLQAGGKTIAVLGSGVNNIYPSTNIKLANQIIKDGGLIVSEYKINEKAKTYYFPAKNRIVANLCKGVLITECTLKSGVMHTKEAALENNRDVFAVPGRATDLYSAGCNYLIQNSQASLVTCGKDIIESYGLDFVEKIEQSVQLNENEQVIVDIIGNDDVHYEQLLIKSKLQAKELNTLLMRLEIKDVITKLPGNYYRK